MLLFYSLIYAELKTGCSKGNMKRDGISRKEGKGANHASVLDGEAERDQKRIWLKQVEKERLYLKVRTQESSKESKLFAYSLFFFLLGTYLRT